MHHNDLPILPGNAGDLPLLGFELWDYPRAILAIEVLLAITGVGLYTKWAISQQPAGRWYIGPSIIAIIFALMAISDLTRLPS